MKILRNQNLILQYYDEFIINEIIEKKILGSLLKVDCSSVNESIRTGQVRLAVNNKEKKKNLRIFGSKNQVNPEPFI
jgi:5-methylcytosine-specific restriction endonuclease McrBC GTP-binding regulatory subunit McrB